MARGSITRRGNSWTIRVDLGLDPVTGKRRQKRETLANKKDADKRLAELLILADQGRLGANPRMTLGEYLERWLADYAATRAPKTQYRYRQIVDSYVIPHLGHLRLDKLMPTHFVSLQSKLRKIDRKDGKGKLSAQTVLHVHRVLHVAMRCAVEWRLITINPMDGVKAPRPQRQEMHHFDAEEATRFLSACAKEGTKWQAFFAALLVTGARPGEIEAATWSDLDMAARALTIQRHVQRIAGQGQVVGDTKTRGSRRAVALGPNLMALLRRHRAEQNAERLQLGSMWQNLDLLFPSETGGYLEVCTVRRVFRRICERAQVPVIRVYDLRHTSATLLLASGVDLKTVSARLGHTDSTLVLSTYGHVLAGAQARASETLEGLLKGAI